MLATTVSTSPYRANMSDPRAAPSTWMVSTSSPVMNRTASKSWIDESRKKPPEVGMYASGGGVWSVAIIRA